MPASREMKSIFCRAAETAGEAGERDAISGSDAERTVWLTSVDAGRNCVAVIGPHCRRTTGEDADESDGGDRDKNSAHHFLSFSPNSQTPV
jgi:hypothetical protein